MAIGILVLAAGQSRRYGKDDKRLAILPNGKAVIQQTLEHCLQSGLPVQVVLRPDDNEVNALCEQLAVPVIVADEAEKGMGHSIAAGVSAIDDWDGCLMALADMPLVQSETYRQVAEALQQHSIVRPVCQGKVGQPNGFLSQYFEDFKACTGDTGARHLLKSDAVYKLEVADTGIFTDIDTPEQLAEITQD